MEVETEQPPPPPGAAPPEEEPQEQELPPGTEDEAPPGTEEPPPPAPEPAPIPPSEPAAPPVSQVPSSAMLASLANSIMSSASAASGGSYPMELTPSRVIQVTNIAPQATRDQMLTLFTFVGRIEDIRLYPSVRDASIAVTARVCFIKFADFASVGIAQHLNNTVFIDRAIIIAAISGNEVPDEVSGLVMAQSNNGNAAAKPGGIPGVPEARKMPSNMINRLEGVSPAAFIMTHDSRLVEAGLPLYPPLPSNTSQEKVEEIRRTVCVVGLDSTVSAQACMEAFSEAGEVKYFRYCTRQGDSTKYALIEFTEHASVVPALRLNDRQLGLSQIKVTHATTAITKPQAKSNEAAQREIEEAMHKVKEAQSLVSATVDPLMGMLHAGSGAAAALIRGSMPRSRSRSRSRRRSRERSRYSSRRSRSRDRRRRTRSRSRSRDRRRRRSRSRSRDRHRRRRSRSRSRDKKRRSRSRDRKKDKERDRERKKEEKDREKKEENGAEKPAEENGKSVDKKESSSRRRSRSRDRDRKRSRSRDRKRSKRSRTRSRERRRRSRSRDRDRRRDRSRSREKKRKDKKEAKVSRDYDQEEAGFEDASTVKKKVSTKPPEPTIEEEEAPPPPARAEDDMDISNSP